MAQKQQYVNPAEFDKPTILRMVVTPTLAKEWLERNTHNRIPKPRQVEAFARDMRAGEWLLTGEAMKFDTDGVMLDGQHRLAACVQSDVPFETFVCFGLDRAAQDGMDRGPKRTVSDVLRLSGVANAKSVGTIIGSWLEYERAVETGTVLRFFNRPVITPREAFAALERRPDIVESAKRSQRLQRHVQLPRSIGAILCLGLPDIDAEDAEYFLSRLEDGKGLGDDHPILALRSRLILNGAKHHSQRMHAAMVWALSVKAWNFYRDGAAVQVLMWKPGGSSPEPTPMPR